MTAARKAVARLPRRSSPATDIRGGKRGQRNVRGKLFIFLWKRLLSPLRYITDTQCGFKVFRAEVVRDMLADVREKKFAFDLELLLKTELRRGLGPAGDPGTGDS
jgi:hypothetical protein